MTDRIRTHIPVFEGSAHLETFDAMTKDCEAYKICTIRPGAMEPKNALHKKAREAVDSHI